MMFTSQQEGMGTTVIRYPRGRGAMPEWKTAFEQLEPGKGRVMNEGSDIAVITIGHVGNHLAGIIGELSEKGISIHHIDIRYLKPLDQEMLHDLFSRFTKILTVEDGVIKGGLGSAVIEFMADHGYKASIRRLGIPDRFVEQGSVEELQEECGYSKEQIRQAITGFLEI
jgi:1-deoxy-D-xylulose-5-phosphate synthase